MQHFNRIREQERAAAEKGKTYGTGFVTPGYMRDKMRHIVLKRSDFYIRAWSDAEVDGFIDVTLFGHELRKAASLRRTGSIGSLFAGRGASSHAWPLGHLTRPTSGDA